MSLGPVEVIVIAFAGDRFSGKILPEIDRLVEARTISVIDGLFARKDSDGTCTFVEIDEAGEEDAEVSALASVFDRFDGLISDEDVLELTAGIEPNSSAAILVFEHTWAKALKDVILDAGGVMAVNVRIPNEAVEEVLAALAESN